MLALHGPACSWLYIQFSDAARQSAKEDYYARTPVFAWDTMSSIRQAKKYTARVNEHQVSAKKLAKAAKLRAKAARIREQVAKHDAKIRSLQRKIADLERKANNIAGPPMR